MAKKKTKKKNPKSGVKRIESQKKGDSKSLRPEVEREIERLLNVPRTIHHKRQKLEYDAFHDLEFQRLCLLDQLMKALLDNCLRKYEFSDWSRCVPYKYVNAPLSSTGSVNSIGGRFNIGRDINETSQAFNALYVAEDPKTALLEKFGADVNDDLDLAIRGCLSKKESFANVQMSGDLHNVFDVDAKDALKDFVDVIKKINFSHCMHVQLKKEERFCETIKTVTALKELLLAVEWRFTPQLYDLPAGSQIFGQIAYRAGIEGILYTSTKSKKKCLAVFVKNLGDESFVKLVGDVPSTVKIVKLNSENYTETL